MTGSPSIQGLTAERGRQRGGKTRAAGCEEAEANLAGTSRCEPPEATRGMVIDHMPNLFSALNRESSRRRCLSDDGWTSELLSVLPGGRFEVLRSTTLNLGCRARLHGK